MQFLAISSKLSPPLVDPNWETLKVVLKKFVKFTGKHLCQSLFFNKVTGLCFPVNFANFLGTPFLQNTPGRLLLRFVYIFNNAVRHTSVSVTVFEFIQSTMFLTNPSTVRVLICFLEKSLYFFCEVHKRPHPRKEASLSKVGVNFAKFLRKSFFTEHLRWLLLCFYC